MEAAGFLQHIWTVGTWISQRRICTAWSTAPLQTKARLGLTTASRWSPATSCLTICNVSAVQVKSFQQRMLKHKPWFQLERATYMGKFLESAGALDVPRQVMLVADPSKIRLPYTLVMWQAYPKLSSENIFMNLSQFLMNNCRERIMGQGYPGWTFMGWLVDWFLLDSWMMIVKFYDGWLLWKFLWLLGWVLWWLVVLKFLWWISGLVFMKCRVEVWGFWFAGWSYRKMGKPQKIWPSNHTENDDPVKI